MMAEEFQIELEAAVWEQDAQSSAWRREMRAGRRAQAPSPCTRRHNAESRDTA